MTFSVYIIEASSPKDFFDRSLDGLATENLLNTMGVTNKVRFVLTRAFLKRAVEEASAYSIVHVSCHGNNSGIAVGNLSGQLNWPEFAMLFQCRAEAPYLVMSSCCGAASGIGSAFEASGVRPPIIFGSTEVLGYSEYSAAWAVLYHRFVCDGLSKDTAQTALKQINAVVHDSFLYRRWDEERECYRSFPPADAIYTVTRSRNE